MASRITNEQEVTPKGTEDGHPGRQCCEGQKVPRTNSETEENERDSPGIGPGSRPRNPRPAQSRARAEGDLVHDHRRPAPGRADDLRDLPEVLAGTPSGGGAPSVEIPQDPDGARRERPRPRAAPDLQGFRQGR